MLDGRTRLVPIIGDPIVYARSPEAMTAEFAARGQNRLCVPMQVREADLAVVLHGLAAIPNMDALLVTMPHKTAACGHCASVSERSALLGVVSVMRRAAGGWHGDILDGLSFVRAQVAGGARLQGARALLLGAGGAGSAIAIALLEAGVRELVVHDTSATRAAALAQALAGRGRVTVGPPDPSGCTMVCNATPLGMAEGDPLPLDPARLTPAMFVGDVIAGHGETAFLRAARLAGCRTADGDQMVAAAVGLMADFIGGEPCAEGRTAAPSAKQLQ